MRSACAREPFYKVYEGKRYCVLHFPSKEKNADFEKVLQRKFDKKDFDFRGVWFPNKMSFRNFKFSSEVDFSFATFSEEVNLRSATFNSRANFHAATFCAAADFSSATFCATAGFSYATFRANADFNFASFDAEADFNSVTFTRDAHFQTATFSREAWFSSATFSAQAVFHYGTFSGAANFSFATFFSPVASFSCATFSARADFSSVSFKAIADFRSTTFSGEADFSSDIFGADAYFHSTTFGAATYFRSTTFSAAADFGYATFADHVKFSGAKKLSTFTDTFSLDLQFARIDGPDHVSFHTLTLRPSWFVNIDARKFDFTNVDWYRHSINEEIDSLRKHRVTSPHGILAIACRHLAVNAEDNHRYEEASWFRYRAMDIRRREKGRGFALWRLSWWYWLASGYGERASQALLVLVGIWLLSALSYNYVGFARWEPKLATEEDLVSARRDDVGLPLKLSRALTYSAGVMTLQKPEPRPATAAAQTVVLLETVLGPVQAALLALAIRRKFMR